MSKPPEWMDDAVDKIIDQRIDSHEFEAAIHGATTRRGSPIGEPTDQEATKQELKGVGIGG